MTSPPFHPLWALLWAEVSLFVGPLVISRVGRRGATFLDGFVIASIVALVGLHLLPEAMSELGVAAIVLAVLGFVAPSLLHQIGRRARSFEAAVWVALGVGLFIHAALDGAALSVVAANRPADATAVTLAVVLHRIPIGLFGWWTLRASGGPRVALFVLLGIALSTVVGFGLGTTLRDLGSGWAVSGLIAFVAGSLLHVLVDHAPPRGDERGPAAPAWLESLGAVLGLGVVGFSEWEHHAERLTPFLQSLGELATRTSPVLVVGLLALAGLRVLARARPRSRLGPALLLALGQAGRTGSLEGAEANARAAGFSGRVALALTLTAGELGIDGLLYSVRLLGLELSITRWFGVLAVTAAAFMLTAHARAGARPEVEAGTQETSMSRPGSDLAASFGFELRSVVEGAAGWIVLGWVAAVGIETAGFDPSSAALPPLLMTAGLALFALPLRLDSLAATPIAAALWANGLSAGAALAFVLAGATGSGAAHQPLSARLGPRRATALSAVQWAVVVAIGWTVDLLPRAPTPAATPIHPSALAVGCAGLLSVAMAAVLAVRGPRRLLTSLFEANALGAHHHPHEPDHPVPPG